MSQKKITKKELTEMIRTMVKESLEKRQGVLKEAKKETKVLSVEKLREMVRDTILEVLNEEVETTPKTEKE